MSRWGLIDNTLEGRQRVFFPHFFNGRVPLDPVENDRWRRRLRLTTNRDDQKLLIKMCSEDLLFYMAGFIYLFDSGDESGNPGPVAFIPYEFQVECLTAMWSALHVERCPLRGKKPRKLGFTYKALVLLEHCWHFMANRHLLIGSHREEEVDGTSAIGKLGGASGEWSKLMPKIDYFHIHLPRWLLPTGYRPRTAPYRSRLKMVNPDNGSIIWGTSAARATAHGERGYAAFWDECTLTENLYDIIGGLSEFAPCKLWISTIGNLDHPFSTVLKDAPGVMQLSPEWWMHPEYSKDMVLDTDTGKRTSPWLVRKLSEINNDPVIANRMYYADETMQVGGYYSADTFRVMTGTSDKPGTVMEPLHIGELDIVETKDGPRAMRWCEQPNGRWRLWFHLDSAGRPSRNTRYIVGVDVAAGTVDSMGRGSSNSVIAFADWMTGAIVAEFVCHGMKPYELAAIAVAAGLWFEGDDFMPAVMIPERNGPGAEFLDEVQRKWRYQNLWVDIGTNVARAGEIRYGWHKDAMGDGARLAFGLHQQMLCDGRLKERSFDCVREMRHYQHNPNGRGAPIHSASIMAQDPSGARDNHGDRVIARICICQALQKPYAALPRAGEAPWGSYRHAKQIESRREWETELV